MSYTVRELSKLAGISVRTLHYYDEVGLLKPSYVKENGYRCYEDKELLKLQQILFFRELEYSIDDIKKIVNLPDFDIQRSLKDHQKLLELKKARIDKLIRTIERTIDNLKGGVKKMSSDDLFDSFDEKQINEYKEEAKKRWGNTAAYKQSMERTKNWTKTDYKKATEEWKKFMGELASTMDKGYDSPEFQELIARQHESINKFYDCSPEMFRGLADMYVADHRFKTNYDKYKPGLAEFVRKAIYYYCDMKFKK